jgi:hypothetical protein
MMTPGRAVCVRRATTQTHDVASQYNNFFE